MNSVKKRIVVIPLVLVSLMIGTVCGCSENAAITNPSDTTEWSNITKDSSESERGMEGGPIENFSDNESSTDGESDSETDNSENNGFLTETQSDNAIKILNLINQEQKKYGKNNVVYSPLSLNYALGLAYEGSFASSYEEFWQYFGADSDVVSDEYHKYRNHLVLTDFYSNHCSDVRIANSVWYKKDIELKSGYAERVKRFYDATCGEFSVSEDSVSEINGWVDSNTNHLIKEMVNLEMLQNSACILVNALYFKGQWETQFAMDETERSDFTNQDGTISSAFMMHGTGDRYFETDKGIGFSKRYYSRGLSFVAFLPNEDSFEIEDFDVKELLQGEKTGYDIIVNMPRFHSETSLELSRTLQMMGFHHVFENADFSNMTDADFSISQVIQKVYIDVDEQGTEAAAATAIGMMTGQKENRSEITITLDRTFIYLIYDESYDKILFCGVVDHLS